MNGEPPAQTPPGAAADPDTLLAQSLSLPFAETPGAPAADWRVWVACFGLWLAPAVTISVSPLMNSVAMDARGLNEAEIGLVRTMEVLLNASLLLYLSTILARLPPRLLGMTGVALMFVGNAGAIPGTGFWDLAAARLAAGAGAACMMSAGSALIARVMSPQRLIGAMAIPITVVGVLSVVIAGNLALTHGQLGAFGVVAACAMAAIPFILFASRQANAPGARSDGALARFFAAVRTPYVLSSLFCYIGGTATWTFFARIGLSHGLDEAQIGGIIGGVSVVSGALGALGAAIRDRWVPAIAIAAASAYMIAHIGISLAPNAVIFIAAFALNSLAFVFIQNTFTVIGVRSDRTGGLNAAGNGWSSLANAAAPASAGLLITTTHSFAPLALLAAAAGALTLFFLVLAIKRLPPLPPRAISVHVEPG